MIAPKITHVQVRSVSGFRWFTADGEMDWGATIDELRDALADASQTLDIPADLQPGWVGQPVDIPKPEPLPEMWVNVYPSRGGYPRATVAPSRIIADDNAGPDRLAVVHLIPTGGGYTVEVERP